MVDEILKLKSWMQNMEVVFQTYFAELKKCELRAKEDSINSQSISEEKEQEWKKAENLLNAAYHIASEKYVGNIPQPLQRLEPVPFNRIELTKKMFAVEQSSTFNRDIEDFFQLIYAQRLWITNERDNLKQQLAGTFSQGNLEEKNRILQKAENELESILRDSGCVEIFFNIMKDYYENRISNMSVETTHKIYVGLEKVLSIPSEFSHVFERYLGALYRGQTISLPIALDMGREDCLEIDYDSTEEYKAEGLLNLLLLEMFRRFEARYFQVSVMDPIKFSENTVGPLKDLIREDGFLLSIPKNHGEIEKQLKQIIQKGEKHCKEKQVIVLKAFPQKYDQRELQLIQQLLANRYEYNVQVIVLHQNEAATGLYNLGNSEKNFFKEQCNCVLELKAQEETFLQNNMKYKAEFLSLQISDYDIVREIIEICADRYEAVSYTNNYHKLFDLTSIPAKKERAIVKIPFGVDEEGNISYCDFENENFSAYISGVSRSGKSTCLHTLIGGIIRNYHPDVAELWLLDFKMMEFRDYDRVDLPHIKYLLLEKSEDLVVDILTKATDELYRRQNIFNYYGFKRLSDVPMDMYMPSIFIIIDEFAQVSQVIRRLSFSGDTNYMEMLENLLAKGAALGFKFIFADQGFVDGVAGLTQKARNQMQMRFAFKNKAIEVEQTLGLTHEELTDQLTHEINILPPHYMLFKYRDESNEFQIKKFHGLNLIQDELIKMLSRIEQQVTEFRDKKPVRITSGAPKMFDDQKMQFEQTRVVYKQENEDEEFLVFPGAPMNMEHVFSFPVWHGTGENILMAGGDADSRVSVMQSVAESLLAENWKVEIHSFKKDICYQKKRSMLKKYSCNTEISTFYERMCQLVKKPEENKLIILFGLEELVSEIELMEKVELEESQKPKTVKVDLFSQMQRCMRGEVSYADKDKLNQELQEADEKRKLEKGDQIDTSKFRGELKKLMLQGPKKGLHFMLVTDDAETFERAGMDANVFRHRLMFRMNMQNSFKLCKSGVASEIEEGKVIYVGTRVQRLLRPYLYSGLTIDRWRMGENKIPEMV